MQISLSGRVVEHDQAGCRQAPEFLRLAQRCAYDGVNLRSRQLTVDTSAADFDRLRAAVAQAGLAVCMINAAAPADADTRGAFERLCERAVALGCGLLRLSITPDNLDAGRWACDAAADHGLRLAQQMHTGAVNETFRMAADWTAKVDRANFGQIVEPANHLMIGEAFSAANLRTLGDRLFMVNLQSLVVVDDPADDVPAVRLTGDREVHYRRVPVETNPGIDVAAAVAALREVGYDGWINMLEPYPEGEDLELFCRDYAAFLRAAIGATQGSE